MDSALNEMVVRAKNGDSEALTELYNETQGLVYCTALKLVKNEADAQDIAQDTYIKAFSSLSTLQNEQTFIKWLLTIAANISKNYLKKSKPMLFEDDEKEALTINNIPEVSEDFLPQEHVDKIETIRLIDEIIDDLPDKQRTAVMLYYLDGLSIQEVAEIMETTDGTIKSRLNYARKKIKDDVEEHERKGTKLYGLAGLPLLSQILRIISTNYAIPAEAGKVILEASIEAATVASTAATTGTVAATAGTATAAGGTATGGAVSGIAAKIAATSIGTKIIAGIVAVGIITGSVVAVHLVTGKTQDVLEISKVEFSKEITDEITESVDEIAKLSDETTVSFDEAGGFSNEIYEIGLEGLLGKSKEEVEVLLGMPTQESYIADTGMTYRDYTDVDDAQIFVRFDDKNVVVQTYITNKSGIKAPSLSVLGVYIGDDPDKAREMVWNNNNLLALHESHRLNSSPHPTSNGQLTFELYDFIYDMNYNRSEEGIAYIQVYTPSQPHLHRPSISIPAEAKEIFKTYYDEALEIPDIHLSIAVGDIYLELIPTMSVDNNETVEYYSIIDGEVRYESRGIDTSVSQ